ncbi:HAD family hydrolase [Haloferula sp. BvORR071]|uniref:HAD family hydrolase n=1 Tax=Haloferula sp. BvORR071 TaxID=1396141 RepID=UPI00054F4518|nr:HAD family hydrolase [Haloferula sp. BvORR071]
MTPTTAGLIFDLDGTLIDSLPGIAASLNRSLERQGFDPHGHPDVRRFIGNGSYELCRRALPEDSPHELILAVEEGFKQDYAHTWPEGTAPYPGIPELLDQLAVRKQPLAILSNKPHPFTVEIVARLFPRIPFDPVTGQREDLRRKPFPDAALWIARKWDLEPNACWFIGDSTVDLETARAAGMKPVITAWGYHDPAALLEAGAAQVLEKVSDLAAVLGFP